MYHSYGPNEWFLKLRLSFIVGSYTKETPNSSDPFDSELNFGPQRVYMRIKGQGLKKRSGTIAASFSHQIFLIYSQENTLPKIEKPIFKLDPILSPIKTSILGTKVSETQTPIENPP